MSDCVSNSENICLNNILTAEPAVKRRGRKRKEETLTLLEKSDNNENIKMKLLSATSFDQDTNSNFIQENKPEENSTNDVPDVKKRGRKPKGGKLTVKPPEKQNFSSSISNVILHLKCSMTDLDEYTTKINKLVTNPLEYNPNIPLNILTYNQTESSTFSLYNSEEWTSDNGNSFGAEDNKKLNWNNDVFGSLPSTMPNIVDSLNYNDNAYSNAKENNVFPLSIKSKETIPENNYVEVSDVKLEDNDENINVKDINAKLKKIKINLYKNQNINKKAACFWCTCDFDNPVCYIPKYELDDKIYGYGSFCRPECAVAYLMKEHIDDSTKFERYHLLNHIYSKVYGFKKNIKPAPCPYYLLDKFYGNLSIQEYRKLLKTEHMLLVIDKPMTRILPELHEENEDLISNIYGSSKTISNMNSNVTNGNQPGVYKVQRQSEKQQGPSKSSILRDKFGL